MPTSAATSAPRRRLLVTGVGGAPGLDLAADLASAGHQVLGTDSNPLAPGLLIPGISSRVVSRADSADFERDLWALVRSFRPEGIISTVERELPKLIALQGALAEAGVRTWLPSRAAATASIDKARFYEIAAAHKIPIPDTVLPADLHLLPDTGDFVVKPRRGQGAKDVYFCHTRRQAGILCELVADPVVQERIRGQEFSADCLVDRSGQASVILRKRLFVHGGASLVAATFHHPQATALVRATLSAVGAVGPCDVQGFLTDDSDARPVVMTEINSRLAAGYRLSQIAGADLVEQALNGLFGEPIDHERLRYRPHVYLTKYTAVLSTRIRP